MNNFIDITQLEATIKAKI
jgi:hypothetical protein